ncbi:DUF6777 domain-containing protein [Streptomyces sp. NBC_01314]|uniref:DUF6777 domain-containing protein n=1 Tax=Streptomyces sp. NBC_01314 TaxID=2903821 RepID=UPI00308DF3A0|nr:PASTA domain-containing protein [Streptomyces sp. NBC_01314]
MGAVVLSGCGDSAPSLLAVKAVAAGVASLAPFFDEGEQLGRDEPGLTPLEPHSGLQQGNTPGLYGGTQKPKVCDVRKLEKFLTAPENKKKAQEWARITGVEVDGIGRYLDELTPVLLRHDTLVKNHDYKKGKAVPFDALLEAGIAVLVDDQGLPAVKCSCGNPLRAFEEDPERIEVKFPGAKAWKGYDRSAVVVVKPAPERLKEFKLVDVEDADRGISRDVGTTGESDTTFDTRARQAVPRVRGMTFGEASAVMADKGLAVTVAGDGMPPGDAPVTGSSPGPGTELEFGAAVALRVDRPGRTSEESADDSEPGSPPGSDSTPTDRNTTPSGGGSGSSPTDGGSSPTESTAPPSAGGTSLTPSPSGSSEKPSPEPEPTPTPSVPPTAPGPSRSSRAPTTPEPDPTAPQDSGPPTDRQTTSAPEPTGGPPSDIPGDPGDPETSGDPSDSGGPGEPGGTPVEDPAQPVWI